MMGVTRAPVMVVVQVYELACRFDLIIVEDDPYRLLFLPEDLDATDEADMPGVTGLPPSLLSMDTEGRVLHLESLSKWIAPGTTEAGRQAGSGTFVGRFLGSRGQCFSQDVLLPPHACRLVRACGAGLRLGWVTGPRAFLEGPFRVWSETTVQFPCTISQAVLAQILRTWGTDGIDSHLRGIQVGPRQSHARPRVPPSSYC